MSGDPWLGQWCRSRFIRALFQFSKCAASEAAKFTKFSRGGVELLGVVGAVRRGCPGLSSDGRSANYTVRQFAPWCGYGATPMSAAGM